MISLDIESNRCRPVSTKHEQQCYENCPDDGWWTNVCKRVALSVKKGEMRILNKVFYILNFIAIGGLGKSALTWFWFNDIAPQLMKLLAGRISWSFYETDATFDNFIIRALGCVTEKQLD